MSQLATATRSNPAPKQNHPRDLLSQKLLLADVQPDRRRSMVPFHHLNATACEQQLGASLECQKRDQQLDLLELT